MAGCYLQVAGESFAYRRIAARVAHTMADPLLAFTPPRFDSAFRSRLEELFRWRRDVRRFRSEPLDEGLLDHLIALALLAPSVGNSQPWRFVKVEDKERRRLVRQSFEICNNDALRAYHGDRAAAYARLKLSGLDKAPAQLAVFADTDTALGHGLGRRTMPETLTWSVVGAVHAIWLAGPGARASGSAGCRFSIRRACARSWRFRRLGRWSLISASAIRKRSTSIRNLIEPIGNRGSRTSTGSCCDDKHNR